MGPRLKSAEKKKKENEKQGEETCHSISCTVLLRTKVRWITASYGGAREQTWSGVLH